GVQTCALPISTAASIAFSISLGLACVREIHRLRIVPTTPATTMPAASRRTRIAVRSSIGDERQRAFISSASDSDSAISYSPYWNPEAWGCASVSGLLRRFFFLRRFFSIDIGSATSLHCAAVTVREPPIATRPANLAREPNVCSTRMASFHFAIRSERENEPTLS